MLKQQVHIMYGLGLGKPEGKRPLARSRRRWHDNIKMDLKNWILETWTGLMWLRVGTRGGRF